MSVEKDEVVSNACISFGEAGGVALELYRFYSFVQKKIPRHCWFPVKLKSTEVETRIGFEFTLFN